MQEVQVKEVARREKGRVFFRFDNGTEFTLYRSEIRGLPQAESTLLMTEDAYLPVSLYEKILTEIVGKRAKKRALFLLERMDRTESQLCEKLRQNGYPEECVAAAVEYVKQYHYIDDLRYAKQYIRYHQQKKSSQRLKMDLMKKGVGREQIEQALAEEFVSDERAQIAELLEKRHYDAAQAERREQQRMYQFLMRRGFKSGDILAVMREERFSDEF